MKVCIIGAGAAGLNTALEIQQELPNLDVTLIADKFNEDTTSDGAAGLFYPVLGFKGPNLETEKKWLVDSYNYYDHLMETENCGISLITGYSLSNISQDECECELMKIVSPEHRLATEQEKNHGQVRFKYGTVLSTLITPCRKILPWSLEKFQKNGGRVLKMKINDVNFLSENYNVIFNCSGLNARYLFNDTEVIPIRGQITQVKAPWMKNFYKTDHCTYIIPCGYNDTVTLGGTQYYGNFNTEIDTADSTSIMERCSRLAPRLRTATVVREWVGLRPYRPEIRVEVEKLNNSVIVHNYGHGGSGITCSPGTAVHSVKLFKNYYSSGKICKL